MAEKTISIKINVDDKSLAELEGNLQGVIQEVKNLDTASSGLTLEQKIGAADGAIKVMAGSLGALVGTLGVLGVETEAFGNFEKKAASVIALTMGLKDLSEGVGKLAIAYDQAGGAAKLFGKVSKTAIASTGIGLLIIALVTVIAYWDDIKNAISGSTVKLREQNKVLDSKVEKLKTSRNLLDIEKQTLVAQGVELGKINTQIKGNLQLELSSLEAKLANLKTILLTQQEQAKDIGFWDKITAAAKNFNNLSGYTLDLAKLSNGISEDTLKTTESISEITTSIAETKRDIAVLDKESLESVNAIADKEEERLEGYKTLLEKYITGLEDLKADSDQKMLDLEKDRAFKEINLLNLSKKEKETLLNAYNNYFELKQKELTEIITREHILRNQIEMAAERSAQEELDQASIVNIENEKDRIQAEYSFKRDAREADTQDYIFDLNRQLDEEKISDDNFFILKKTRLLRDKELDIADKREREARIKEMADFEKIMAIEVVAYKMDIALQGAMFLSDLLLELFDNSKDAARIGVYLEKAVAVAGIVANTALANAKAVAAFPLTLGQPWVTLNSVSAGIAIAGVGLAAGQALSVINNPAGGGGSSSPNLGGGGGGGGNSTRIGTDAPITPVVQPTVRTYVLTGDVTSAQEAEAKLNARRNVG